MLRRDVLKLTLSSAISPLAGVSAATDAVSAPATNRAYWLMQMQRVASPVLNALAHGKLKATMPIEAFKGAEASRKHTTYLEAFGRLLCGIAPWLEHGPTEGDEGKLRSQYLDLVHAGMAAAVDTRSPDYMEFGGDRQTVVDAAFFSLAILRAPQTLNKQLSGTVRSQLAEALRKTRAILPGFNNWLLFSAGVEAALFALGEAWDRSRVDYALREHMGWYLGDGAYGDGPHLHWDYYNSFVIQPFLLAVLDAVGAEEPVWKAMHPAVQARARRYAEVQERTIAPDGTYPLVGRSLAYRCGAFHLLADASLRQMLPAHIAPEQVRCALAAVMHRTLGAPGTFDANGWLRIGVAGHQPSMGESYISTGSLYLCAAAFLPLGLKADDRFWSAADAPWTAKKLWSGTDMPPDHAMDA